MKGLKIKLRNHKLLRIILVLSNWFLQGIHNSDWTEKLYRMLFTMIFWLLFYYLFGIWFDLTSSLLIPLCFIIAHTVNWVINGNFHLLLVHRLMIKRISKEAAFTYIEELERRIKDEEWVLYTVVFGSICRGSFKDSSDLDISIVRKSGFINGLRSIVFAVKEKKLADFKSIPLELYVSDSPQNSIHRFGAERNPLVISDRERILKEYYEKRISILEARTINGIS